MRVIYESPTSTSQPYEAESGDRHLCDFSALLANVSRTLQCVCGVIIRDYPGPRIDADTGQPHVHQPPPQPAPLIRAEGPEQILDAPSGDKRGWMSI